MTKSVKAGKAGHFSVHQIIAADSVFTATPERVKRKARLPGNVFRRTQRWMPFMKRLFPGESSDAEAGYHREVQAHIQSARTILDFGCGDNSELARYRSEAHQVWGVDTHAHPHLQHPDWFRRLSLSGQGRFRTIRLTSSLPVGCWNTSRSLKLFWVRFAGYYGPEVLSSRYRSTRCITSP